MEEYISSMTDGSPHVNSIHCVGINNTISIYLRSWLKRFSALIEQGSRD